MVNQSLLSEEIPFQSFVIATLSAKVSKGQAEGPNESADKFRGPRREDVPSKRTLTYKQFNGHKFGAQEDDQSDDGGYDHVQ